MNLKNYSEVGYNCLFCY